MPARSTAISAIAALSIFTGTAAQAEDWKFCVSTYNSQSTIYLSSAFPGDTIGGPEVRFGQVLEMANLPHDSVQCALGSDEQTVRDMRDYAVRYNQNRGMTVINIPWPDLRGSGGHS